ncbi:MAG: DEAD/DEAH box helicase, partial [Micromonosporaceae bacterium]
LVDAMPPEARAVPLPGTDLLPDAATLVRAFCDAVADVLPRTPAAATVAGTPAYAAVVPQQVIHLRPWTEEVAAGIDSGVRISLRLELAGDTAAGDAAEGVSLIAVVQVHSLADPGLLVDAAGLWDQEHPGFGARSRIDTMLAVRRAALAWPPLARLLTLAVPDQVELTDRDVEDLVATGAARLAAVGVDVHWPRQLVRDLSASAVVGGTEPADDRPGFFGAETLFGFDWRLALGDQPLTEAELDQLAEAHRPVVRLRDQWTLVDPELVARARQRRLKPLTAIDALGVALTGQAEIDGRRVAVTATGNLARLRDQLTREVAPAEQPPALRATLRGYQLAGLRWLDRMTSLGLGGCLADDMGLGKTITLIALHLHRDAAAPTLVVCPASLLGNWEREIERFAPGTPVRRFHGPGRDLDGAERGFVLTTYGTMRIDARRLAGHEWDLVVADEAQHVKNPRAGTAKALRTIPARARVALSGTPVENNLTELWSILDWTTPGLLGTLTSFRTRWATPIESGADPGTAHRLARLVRPFLLRRRKSDPGIAPELPPKTETDQPVPLTPEQAGLYQALVRETLDAIREATGMERRGLVMKLLTGLKQICNHPAQFLKEPSLKEPGPTEPSLKEPSLKEPGLTETAPDGAPRFAGRSGKLELLDELLETIVAEDGAALVFTQYVAMARLLHRHLAKRGIQALLLHGGTPVPAREAMVDRFQAGDAPVFLLSLKAAGTGLNLTRADHVIHYDRWWNPAVEDQATDRAYRIGQTRPVQVHKLIAEGTLEDRIAQMLVAKRDLADAVLRTGEAALTELTDAELAELVELRRAR